MDPALTGNHGDVKRQEKAAIERRSTPGGS